MPNKTEDRQLHDISNLIIETFLYQILTKETFDFHSTLHINLHFKKWALKPSHVLVLAKVHRESYIKKHTHG